MVVYITPVPYTQVSNKVLQDQKISLAAKGMFAFLRSRPSGYNFTVEEIALDCNEEKSDILAYLHELEKADYFVRSEQI